MSTGNYEFVCTSPAKAGGVVVLERLEKAIESASSRLEALASHLHPVRENVCEEKKLDLRGCVGCPSSADYFRAVQDAANRVNAIADRIDALIGEIEL